MTGPEHYREAERLLEVAAYHTAEAALTSRGSDRDADFLRAAQVHATLALVAATVIQPSSYGCDRPEWTEWAAVASVETAAREQRARRGEAARLVG